MNVAYNVDCMEYMATLPDKYFDLAVCDPPYGIGEGGQKAASRGKQVDFGKSQSNAKAYNRTYPVYDDSKSPDRSVFKEIIRVSQNQIIFGANHFISKIPYDSHCWIVWDKQNDTNDFSDCELAWTSFKGAVRVFRYRWNGMLKGEQKSADRITRIHPNEKPRQLYRWIYSRYAETGQKIFDPFLGSGSSRIVAYDAGLDFVGCEIDETYFRLQEERFAAHTAQMNLFLDAESVSPLFEYEATSDDSM